MKALLTLAPEITTKARRTRARFARKTAVNVRRALADWSLTGEVRREHDRLHLEYDDPRAPGIVARVFGVNSVLPCSDDPVASLDEVIAKGVALMGPRIDGRTYAVRARVRDEALPFRSQMVNEWLGEALLPFGKVRLKNPDVTVRVEVRDGRMHFYADVLRGEGGIPLGEGGRATVLLSAGFDSAVAAYLMMRRGVAVDFVSCRLGGVTHERAVLGVANRLAQRWSAGVPCQLTIVPFEETVEVLRTHVEERYRQLVLKRLMYRTALAVGRTTRSEALVTGESLGQVSSQTMQNLRALGADPSPFILRPLLTANKNEILALAQHVGTHDLCAGVPEYCALGSKPATAATRGRVRTAEDAMPFEIETVLAGAIRHRLPHLVEVPADRRGTRADGGSAARLAAHVTATDVMASNVTESNVTESNVTESNATVTDAMVTDSVPPGAVVLDMRSPPVRRRQPIEHARVVEPLSILERPEQLEAAAHYVVVCDAGARSLWFAGRLRELGFQARALVPVPDSV